MKFTARRLDPSSAGDIRPTHLRLTFDQELDQRYTILTTEKLTDASSDAKVIESTTLELTQEEVVWLHAASGLLLQKWRTPQALIDEAADEIDA